MLHINAVVIMDNFSVVRRTTLSLTTERQKSLDPMKFKMKSGLEDFT